MMVAVAPAVAPVGLQGMERFLLRAVDAGLARDQVTNFLRFGYVPQQKQMLFHVACRSCDAADGPDQVGFGGARGPGKSHAVFAQVALDDCQRFSGLKVLYLRKVGKAAREQFDDFRRRVLHSIVHEWSAYRAMVEFPNGSRIIIGNFRNENDIDSYLGLEYDVIVVEEATTLSELKYQALLDSCRSSKVGWRARVYTTTNPGNIGHAWFKRRFVDPYRKGVETDSRFVPATVDDNVYISSDYVRRLEKNVGWRLRAYRWGDWDISAGMFFSGWREASHVIEPFDIPGDWRVWCGFDYGFVHPTVFTIFTRDGEGHVYVIGEWVASRLLPERHLEGFWGVVDRLGIARERVYPFAAGRDVFVKKDERLTIAEQYMKLGVRFTPAVVDRVSGASRCLRFVGDPEEGVESHLSVFSNCVRLIETIPRLISDPHRPEDVLKVDVDEDGQGGDDSYDSWRYGLMVNVGGVPSEVVPAADPLEVIDAGLDGW